MSTAPSMVVPVGALEHEVPAETRGEAAAFDREGYAVGRQVLAPDVLRAVRAPLIEALVADGQVEPVEGEEDRFRWIGDRSRFDKAQYHGTLAEAVGERLLRSGLASKAIETIWGRRQAIWEGVLLYVMIPGDPTRVHRDGWQMMGVGEPDQHANFWCPLTRLGGNDGALAVAVGSHRMIDQPWHVPMPHPIHQDVLVNTNHRPPAEELAPLWRTTCFELGDALLFRPDIVHSTTSNDGPYLRISFALRGQEARLPLAIKAGLSLDRGRDLADVEWLTLAVLAVQPTTPWLARCAGYSRGIIGRLWTELPDQLVERAFTTLEARGLIEPHEPLDKVQGWIHRYYRITPRGRTEVAAWFTTPGYSAAEERLLALKLLFCDWLGLDATDLLAARGSRRNGS